MEKVVSASFGLIDDDGGAEPHGTAVLQSAGNIHLVGSIKGIEFGLGRLDFGPVFYRSSGDIAIAIGDRHAAGEAKVFGAAAAHHQADKFVGSLGCASAVLNAGYGLFVGGCEAPCECNVGVTADGQGGLVAKFQQLQGGANPVFTDVAPAEEFLEGCPPILGDTL